MKSVLLSLNAFFSKLHFSIRKRKWPTSEFGLCRIVLQFIILDNVSKSICQSLQIIKIIWFENLFTLYKSKQIYKNVKMNKYIKLIKKICPLCGHILIARFARSSLRSQVWARLGRAIWSSRFALRSYWTSRFALGPVLFAYI